MKTYPFLYISRVGKDYFYCTCIAYPILFCIYYTVCMQNKRNVSNETMMVLLPHFCGTKIWDLYFSWTGSNWALGERILGFLYLMDFYFLLFYCLNVAGRVFVFTVLPIRIYNFNGLNVFQEYECCRKSFYLSRVA